MTDLYVKIVRGLIVVLAKFPLKFHYFMGDVLSLMAEKLLRYRSDVVWVNLSRSFPDKPYKAVKEIYRGFYRHFGEIFAEAIWFGGSSYGRLNRQGIVRLKNPQVLSGLYAASPSVTVLSTHCGNWELLGGLPEYRTDDGRSLGIPEEAFTVVYKKLSSDVSDKVFALNRIAPLERVGTECEVESRNILRYSIRHKDEKRIYIYPADQAPYSKSGPHPIGEFMNQRTMAMTGSVGVACRLSHAVVYMKMKRLGRGRYEMEFIPICDDASSMTPETLIRRYYDLLEEEIRETPDNWLWSHKRWK